MVLLADPALDRRVANEAAPSRGRRGRSNVRLTAEQSRLAGDYYHYARGLARKALSRSAAGRILLTREPDVTDLVAHDALVRAARSYDPTRRVRFGTWVGVVLRSRVLDATRPKPIPSNRAEAAAVSLPPDHLVPALARTESGPAAIEAADLLEYLSGPLTPQAREALCRLAAGADVAQVARERGVSDKAVYRSLSRARPKLAARLAAQDVVA